MTRLLTRERHVSGWVHGIIEDADPDAVQPPGQGPLGVLDSGRNFVPTTAGRQRVRNGSQVRQTLHESGAGNPVDRVIGLAPYTSTGMVAIGHYAATPKHFIYRLSSDASFFTGAEATSRHDLSWNSATPARPQIVELFEQLFVVDSTIDYATRQEMKSMNSSGVVAATSFDFVTGGAGGVMKPYCAAPYNSHLFVAGYGDETSGDEPHLVRHSFLGRDPAAANGFDKDAYALIGAVGQRVEAMCPGRGILLVAKENDLYRISGTGRAREGWQFAIEQVDATRGLGVSNPLALCHAEGSWFGVGRSGPFVTDGTEITPLVGSRRRSWGKVTNVDRAWVTYHPDRRLVLFGFNMTPVETGRSSTDPYVIWTYDLERGGWQSDWAFSADVFVATPVTGALISGPAAAPSALTVDDAAATETTLSISWTNGDASAATEVYLATGGGGSVLYDTADPGETSMVLTGQPHSTAFLVKVRHKRNGITTDFTAEEEAHTKLEAPTIDADDLVRKDRIRVRVTQQSAGSDLRLYRDSVLLQTWSAAALGTYTYNDFSVAPDTVYSYEANSYRSDWPAVIDTSDTVGDDGSTSP